MKPAVLECPTCTYEATGESCNECGQDLTILWRVRRTAEQLAASAWRLAAAGNLSLAYERASRAAELYPEKRSQQLCAWLAFLSGDAAAAVRQWGAMPDEAKTAANVYNEALEDASCDKWLAAQEKLVGIEMPLAPALLLRAACADRLEDTASSETLLAELQHAFPDWSPEPATSPPTSTIIVTVDRLATGWLKHPAAAVGVAALLLFFGVGIGRLAAPVRPAAGVSRLESPTQPLAAEASHQTEPNATDTPPLAWSYVAMDTLGVPEALGESNLAAAPAPMFAALPVPVRSHASRAWYLLGFRAHRAGNVERAAQFFNVAVTGVGAKATDYWVDDALYLLMHTLADAGSTSAARVAGLIQQHHPQSIYNNSVTRAVVAGSWRPSDEFRQDSTTASSDRR